MKPLPQTTLNRLTQVSAVNRSWGIAWQYDAYGNRWSQTPSGQAAAGNTVGTQNWGGQLSITNSPQSYDAAGNLTSIGAYLPVYTYDTENRIKNIDNGVVDFATLPMTAKGGRFGGRSWEHRRIICMV